MIVLLPFRRCGTRDGSVPRQVSRSSPDSTPGFPAPIAPDSRTPLRPPDLTAHAYIGLSRFRRDMSPEPSAVSHNQVTDAAAVNYTNDSR